MSDAIKRYCFDHDFEQVVERATGAFVHISDVVAMVREVAEKHLANQLDGAFPPWEILRRLGEEP